MGRHLVAILCFLGTKILYTHLPTLSPPNRESLALEARITSFCPLFCWG